MSKNSLPSHNHNIEKVKLLPNNLPNNISIHSKNQKPNYKKNIIFMLSTILSTAILVVASYLIYFDIILKGGLQRSYFERNSPLNDSGPINILILGTDTRKGEINKNFGDSILSSHDGNSDTMMLVHISKGFNDISIISFPRDLMVYGPECKNPNNNLITKAQNPVMLNSILSYGGPECSVKAFNNFTGVKIDHFMKIDFNSVIELSKIIGGVEICVDAPVNDPFSDLKLPAGNSTIEGEQALAFLRSRHGVGDGSDIARIKSQQQFLANMSKKIKNDGVLMNPLKINEIAKVMLKYVHFDKNMSNITNLIKFVNNIKNIPLNNITFLQVPIEPYYIDENRVQLKEPEAQNLFNKIKNDKFALNNPSSKENTNITVVDKSQIEIKIFNYSGKNDREIEVVNTARRLGYEKSSIDFPDKKENSRSHSSIYYPDKKEKEAQEVLMDFGIDPINIHNIQNIEEIQLVIGADWLFGDRVNTSKKSNSLNEQTASENTCQVAAKN